MDRLNAMRVFVNVVDAGSLSAAADKLDMSRPVVTRYVAELEQWTGARLLHRTTRRLSLTAAGEELLPRCRQVLELALDMQAAVRHPAEAPRGQLRITASMSFAQAQLADAVADYVRLYPGVAVDLVLLDRAVNLVDERIDLAIRVAAEIDPNLIARRLTDCRSVVCASPAYLQAHGLPLRVEELAQRNCLTHSYFGRSLWNFTRKDTGEPASVAVGGNVSANDAASLMYLARAGAGVAMLPTYLTAPLLQRGNWCGSSDDFEPQVVGMYAVYASRKHMPATLRTMLDFLAARFTEVPAWDVPLPPRA
jgi:DNA-binding transcriptional LysR family regulator